MTSSRVAAKKLEHKRPDRAQAYGSTLTLNLPYINPKPPLKEPHVFPLKEPSK